MTRSIRPFAAAIFAVVTLGGTAFAAQEQAPPPPPGAHGPGHDAHRLLPRTRDEATAAADRMFAKLDTNRDGQVTAAEFAAAREARQERREARGKAKGGRGQKMGERMFARMDTDRNGSVSQAEHRAAALARFQRIDTNGDGRIDDTELQAMRDKRMTRRGPSPSPQQSPNGE